MKVSVNGNEIILAKPLNLYDLACFLNMEADVFIVNSFPKDISYIVKENDNISLIKKGVMPAKEHLEHLLCCRQGKNITDILKNSKVVICGCGGLGSHVAISLARTGLGNIKLIDFDVVEPSNINRQYYFIDQIGRYKTDALKENINKINPYIHVETKNVMLDNENIINEVAGFQVIVECFDNTKSKLMLMENCIKKLPHSFIIGASGVAGYFDTDIIKIKKLGKNILIVGDFENEASEDLPLMAPRVTACASIQANETIKYLLQGVK